MQKYTYPRLHTLRTAQGSTVPCVGWNLGFERKLKMTTVKKFRRERRSRRKRYVIIIPPKACSPYLDDRYQSQWKV
jgi:histidyl-tRNA synthetase